tara:strand:- start:60 stop:389 length:330 start_codon:yes stop_codon:yes gene_type:complete
MLSFCLVGVDPTKQKNRIHMTSLDQNVMGWTAGIPEAVKLMKTAALKLYAEVVDRQVPGVENYTFGDYIEDLAQRALMEDRDAAATLGAMIDAAAEMEKMISEDLLSRS